MAKKFDVNILLHILTEGTENFDKLADYVSNLQRSMSSIRVDALDTLARSGKAALTPTQSLALEVDKLFKSLAQPLGGVDSYRQIAGLIEKVRAGAKDVKIDLQAGPSIEQLKTLRANLDSAIRIANKSGDTELLKGASIARREVAGLVTEMSKLLAKQEQASRAKQIALPTGIAGFFASFGKKAEQANAQIGGLNGVLRAAAGSFRLFGTAAFLVGGQLRTVGFAGSALGSLLQNFGPLAVNIVSAFGPLGGVFLAFASALGIVAVQALASAAAFTKILEAGFEFNDKFKKVENSVAAVAREFFDFKLGSGKLADEFGVFSGPGGLGERFALSSNAVRKELQALQYEATQTEFTSQDLFTAFQSTVTSLGALSPSLTKARQLTGLFARAASVAGVPVQQLAQSITQVVSGSGRLTNKLYRDVFAQLKDSEGIKLTSDRIRELRAQGGTRLFDELFGSLKRYTEGLGRLQSTTTLSGAFSNIKDVFQIFAGRVTNDSYILLTKTIAEIATGAQIIKGISDDGVVEFAAPFEKLRLALSGFTQTLTTDLTGVIAKVVNYLTTLGEFFLSNYETISTIYLFAKEIVKSLALILYDLASVFGLVNSTGGSLGVVKNVLAVLLPIVAALRFAFNAVYVIVLGMVYSLNRLVYLAGKLAFSDDLKDTAAAVEASLDNNIRERIGAMQDAVNTFDNALDKAKKISSGISAKVGSAGADVTTTPVEGGEFAPGKKGTRLSTLEGYKDVFRAIVDLAKDSEDGQLRLTQSRLEKQKVLIQQFAEIGVISETDAQQRIASLRNAGITNEIQTKRNQIEALNKLAILGEQAAQKERLKLQQDELDKEVTKRNPTELAVRINNVALGQIAETIKRTNEVRGINNEIANLESERLSIQTDLLKYQIESTGELVRQRAELKATVAELQFSDTFQSLAEKFKSDIISVLPTIRKAEEELKFIAQSISSGIVTNVDELNALKRRKDLLTDIRSLTIQEIALKRQRETFSKVESSAQERLNRLSVEEDQIRRNIELGTITPNSGEEQIALKRKQYNVELQKLLDTLKAISDETPFNQEQIRKVEELKQAVDDLGISLTENVLLKASSDARQSFVDLFVGLQENVGKATDSLKSFASSVLSIFRRLLAEKIVREFFSKLFPEEGQTKGRAKGLFAGVLRSFNLDPATRAGQRASAVGASGNSAVKTEIDRSIEGIKTFTDSQQRRLGIEAEIAQANTEYLSSISPFIAALNSVTEELKKLPDTIKGIDLKSTVEGILETLRDSVRLVSETLSKAIKDGSLFKDVLNPVRGSRISTTPNFGSLGKVTVNPSDKSLSTGVPSEYKALIEKYAGKNGVDATVLTELVRQESKFNPKARSDAGAVGLTQFMKATAKEYGLIDSKGNDFRTDPEKSIEAGARYLAKLLRTFNGDYGQALAAYNAGPGRVIGTGGDFSKLPAETRDYVPKILGAAQNAGADITTEFLAEIESNTKETADALKNTDSLKSDALKLYSGKEKLTGNAARYSAFERDKALQKELRAEVEKQGIIGNFDGFNSKQLTGLLEDDKRVKAKLQGKQYASKLPPTASGADLTLESLRNQARARGMAFSPEASAAELRSAIDADRRFKAEKYARQNSAQSATLPSQTLQKVTPVAQQAQPAVQKPESAANLVRGLTSSGFDASKVVPAYIAIAQEIRRVLENYKDPQDKDIVDAVKLILANPSVRSSDLAAILSILKSKDPAKATEDFKAQYKSLLDAINLRYSAPIKKASGGAIYGRGGGKDDKIPAMLSNGEYVIQSAAVKYLGVPALDRLNNIAAYARGGKLIDTDFIRSGYVPPTIDTSKFNYSGGSASLINKPAPIVEPPPKVKKKKSGFFSFLGNILGFAAPFLGLIPGIGPLLSLITGAAGGALAGSGQGVASGIIGGLLGGLSNLGGLAKGDGKFASFAKFFGSGGEGSLLSGLGGASTGNFGDVLGSLLKSKLNIFGKLKNKFAYGGMVSRFKKRLPRFAFGGFSGGALGSIGQLLKGGGGKGSGDLLKTLFGFGLTTILGSLSNRTAKEEDDTLVDPDQARKNRFGTAYDALGEYGIIPKYKYQQKTLDDLRRGSKFKPVEKGTSGFSGFLNSLLPLLLSFVNSEDKSNRVTGKASKTGSSILNALGKSGSKNSGGVANLFKVLGIGSGDSLKRIFGRADGGMITGPGTSRSDSILALLSNGEYVIQASAVKSLGTDILDSINTGRFRFASGGLAGAGVSAMPNIDLASPVNDVQVSNNTKIVNVLDPQMVGDYLQTPDGYKVIMNIIARRPKEINSILKGVR